MKHTIPRSEPGTALHSMSEAVQACVHCGFCLPACPTYQVLGQEMDTPRGRIVLMKEVLEGTLPLAQALPHVDRCLGCLACETACPSGVKYRELLSPFRDRVRNERPRTFTERLRRRLLLATLPYPARFRFAAKLGLLTKPLHRLLPRALRPMLSLLPDKLPARRKLREVYPAQGPRRARVALLAGCAQQVLAPEINAATISVLTRCGVEVIVPRSQGCCGALAWHVGAGDEARRSARKNLVAFPDDIDAIITNAAGCGSGLHEYPLMLQGTPDESGARAFAHRVQDVSVFLERLGVESPPAPPRALIVAYHDACHLSHAQGVRSAPRELLRRIPGLVLREIADAEICCGSAGTYNIDQPGIAASLGQTKAANIAATGADFVVTGNIGCMTQIAAHLRAHPNAPRLLHTMELLALAFEGRAEALTIATPARETDA
jgi:glycolate oxidase iron-sulfur subunit